LKDDARWNICRETFADEYFKRLGEEPIVDVDEAYERLKSEHKSVFDGLQSSDGKELERVTDVRLIDNIVVFDGTDHVRTYNYAWTCLTRHRRTNATQVYFVSDRFNVAMNAAASKSAGHFILQPDEENTKTTVKALVEEPAYEIFRRSKLLEMQYYVWYRKSTAKLGRRRFWYTRRKSLRVPLYSTVYDFIFAASTADSDPLCRLAKLHKIRVCAKVLKSPFLRKKIAFVPDERLFKDECVKREVSFRSRSIRKEVNRLEEWMLWCPTKSIRTAFLQRGRVDYFVSRAAKSGEAFLYSRTSFEGQIFLESLLEEFRPYV
jgi:hypothetical protein